MVSCSQILCACHKYQRELRNRCDGQNGFAYNYWSDWAGRSDNNEDEIIDSPHPIEGGSIVDHCLLANALMKKYPGVHYRCDKVPCDCIETL